LKARSFLALLLLLAFAVNLQAQTGVQVQQRVIQCAPGWKAELVAEHPLINYPSMICTTPDGRVFVGQDPVDMGAKSDSASDSILCVYPDGQVLTFATNLHAVYGLQYIDGKLYVHHTPKFSVFDDHFSKGVNRVDLITNDNPHPWDPSFNDHVPSNCHLGMDGYLYISTGDKGVYGAVGTDGRKLELHGGGIYRMRPNGTELEVYSTGTRNHLDIALNSEDEMFTYDNTDDGVGWWTRVTHMVDGGFYGYPYDYKPQRPYTLWKMTDFGGGAPTGACAYNEDALPDEYKGNLFLCDWVRGQVLRLKVERDGASYKFVSRVQEKGLDFLTKGETDHFFPTGICVDADGKGFYVCDWGQGTWKHLFVIGRLYHVTYTGKTQETPKPDWFVPAGTGQKFEATTSELIAGLSHPAESVRMVAQRRLSERKDAEPKLTALLKDTKVPAWARWHAIWALDAIDGGKKARKKIIAALKDKDPRVVMQAERELGTRRVDQAVKPLLSLLNSPNAAVRFRAATALGRIGDPAAVPALMKSLDEKNLFAHYADFYALHRIGLADPKAWPQIVAGFNSPDPGIRQGAQFATRETYDPGLVKALAVESARHDIPVDVRTNTLGLLSSLSLERPPWKGEWWNTTPANGQPAAKTKEWAGTPIVSSALRDTIEDSQPQVRAIGLQWLRTSHDTNAVAELAKMYQRETNVSARVAIVLAFPPAPTPESRTIISSILKDKHAPAALLQAAVEIAGKNPKPDWDQEILEMAQTTRDDGILASALEIIGQKKMTNGLPILSSSLYNQNTIVHHNAIEAIKQIGGQPAIDALIAALDKGSVASRAEIISTLGIMKAKSAVPKLLESLKQTDLHDMSITALTQIGDLAAFDVYLDGLGSKNTSVRVQCENALRALRAPALPLIVAKLEKSDLPAPALASLKQLYAGDPEAKKNSVFRHKVLEVPPGQYQDFALSHPGDARRGSKLFHDLKGVGCIRCHKIKGEGGDIGPDLTSIRAKYSRADVIESVLYPSKQILDGYQQVLFETKNDDDVSGVVRLETATNLTVVDSAGIKHVLDKSNITSRKTSKISLMPEGLQDGLSLLEFSDLIAYVENPNVPAAPAPVPNPASNLAAHRPRAVKRPPPIVTAAQTAPAPPDLNADDMFSPFGSTSKNSAPTTDLAPPVPLPMTPARRHSEPRPNSSAPPAPADSDDTVVPIFPQSGPNFPPAPGVPPGTN
jgi:putative heme-binding domain-containing protein